MTTINERDETDTEWPTEADRINLAICPLIVAVFELTADGSPERVRAMTEVLESAERVRRALMPVPRLN